ncbi:DUF6932 family protein [Pseudomonas sp. CCOS 191]|uniref:DUF6932 family protein n=1 Tax=Pseudomonas sp. CCOS 191 TaxID=1649877 RepID=UPI000624BBE9|nr:hypothetical protein [Pseudomonas sp. CCOS 191]CRI56369.1 hypothetical protein CCOS191_1833 [Pseudomonas sp. CCOS 191]
MSQEKVDYPPLLAAGIHPFSLEQLRSLTVDGFPNSSRRSILFGGLSVYVELLQNAGLKSTIWVDGSFMCAKDDPQDIDLVVVYDPENVDSLSEAALPVVNNLLNSNFAAARFGLHVFKVESTDQEGLDFWMQKFGTQRDETTPKGLAALRLN